VSCAKLYLDTERLDYNTRTKLLFESSACDGKLDVLKWGHGSGYELETILENGEIADVALNGQHLEVVQYLRTIGIEWDERTCSHAAEGGHLELLKWARANGCPWDKWTCSSHLEHQRAVPTGGTIFSCQGIIYCFKSPFSIVEILPRSQCPNGTLVQIPPSTLFFAGKVIPIWLRLFQSIKGLDLETLCTTR